MAPRRVVYTVQVGGYETLLPQYFAAGSSVDFVCFTDQPDLVRTGWQMRLVDVPFPDDANRSSRRPKLLPHEYLAGYDESLYIDNTVLLTKPPEMIFDELLPEGADMAVLQHSFRATLRDEFDAVVAQGNEAFWVCDEQLAHYERSYAGVLDAAPIWGGLLLRRHHDPLVRETMQIWWEHVLRFSRRDQLALPVALHLAGMKAIVHELSNDLSPYHEWPRGAARRKANPNPMPPGPVERILELDTLRNELTEQVQKLHQINQDLRSELDTTRSKLRKERSCRRRYVLKIQRSLSWRVTAPLRGLGTLVRRIRRAATRSER